MNVFRILKAPTIWLTSLTWQSLNMHTVGVKWQDSLMWSSSRRDDFTCDALSGHKG